MPKITIPFWIIGICAVLASVIITFGASMYIDPNLFLDDVLVASEDVIYLINRWGGTMIAIGVTMVIALIVRSVSMLKTTLIAFCIMTLQDAVIGFAYFKNSIMTRSILMCAVSIFMIIVLNGIKPKRKRRRSSSTLVSSSSHEEDDE